ncbi:MAG: coenzyme F420-0:L-glutamate ligase [SAR324 cluster bacterium]|nr:coenzyme F420-0:L-glutamate ligase [SAR324 cluster bacterium]
MSLSKMTLFSLPGFPLVKPGDDLTFLIQEALASSKESLLAGDVVVIAQKVFSKAQNRYVDLNNIVPSEEAVKLAEETQKDPRVVELILSESTEVVRHRPGVMVVAHRLGMVMANAGIDASNVDPHEGQERVLLLPKNPNNDCLRMRKALQKIFNVDLAVIMNDSVGRAWRLGTAGIALGASGISPLWDLRGKPDLFGRPLLVSQTGLADEISAAASILQGQGNEGTPIVIVRGLHFPDNGKDASSLLRAKDDDLFR